MSTKLQILQHSLGFKLGINQYKQERQYRNHFVTGEGSNDYRLCCELVAEGLMTSRKGNELSGGDTIFSVTQKGIDFVEQNRPTAPPLPEVALGDYYHHFN